jgi:hypothetical protein
LWQRGARGGGTINAARNTSRLPGTPAICCIRAFVQILGKFYFFKLSENLRRILFDYEENRPGTANAPFKGAC